jgi:hypothetical protein
LKNNETRYVHNQTDYNNNDESDRKKYDSQDMVFAATSKNEKFTEDIWIMTVKLLRVIEILLRTCSMLKRLMRASCLVMASV